MLGKLNRWTRRKLMDHGTAAPATVVEISEKGMSVTNGSEGVVSNTELIVKTRLRIDPEGEPSFEVHQRFRYPQLAVPSVGDVLRVRFDPEDHDKVMLDPDAVTATLSSGGTDLSGLLATVQQARAQAGHDPQAMAEALQASLGIQGVTVMNASAFPGMGDADTREEERIRNLERLVALRDQGALSPEEFATRKAALLAEA